MAEEEILFKIVRIIESPPLREADVQHLFTLLRKLIERVPEAFRSRYTQLKLYCDWTMHSAIDRSLAGANILAQAQEAIVSKLEESRDFSDTLTAALSLDAAKDQMNELLTRFGVGAILSDATWQQAVPIVAEIISHCPLKIDSKQRKLEDVVKKMKARPIKGRIVEELDCRENSGANLQSEGPCWRRNVLRSRAPERHDQHCHSHCEDTQHASPHE
jgi:hypothetical protein